MITSQADPDAQIIFGAAIDEKVIDQIKVTVVATGFDETRRKFAPLTLEDAETKVLAEGEEPQDKDDQIDESQFDIPTFLRQIR